MTSEELNRARAENAAIRGPFAIMCRNGLLA